MKKITNPIDRHQFKILIDTVKNPLKGIFLGGPTQAESIEILKTKFKLTTDEIERITKTKSGRDW